MKKLEIQNVKGTCDYGSKEQSIRNYIIDTLKKVFEEYGYKPLETSILCYYELLALKYDEDNDILNEIYKVKDQGDRNLALRYDLTVPFAKYIASNPNIKMPYKRYEIGKVFRDGPVKLGRVREFIQCDVDSVGIEGQLVEAELIELFIKGCKKLGVDVYIKYNNRKIMSGFVKECDIEENKISQVITVIDKFEKLSKEEIKEEFLKVGIDENQIEKLIKLLSLDFKTIEKLFKNTNNIELLEGINEISELNKYLEGIGLKDETIFSSSLARGQEYYTGTIFEAYVKDGSIKSSLGGGGRYDKMIGDFIGDGKVYPAVGISFGLEVLFEILKNREALNISNTKVYIIPMKNNIESLKIAKILRDNNISVDIEMNSKKIKKSLDYANQENIPFVIIIGDDELKENKVVFKDMLNNSQEIISIEEIIKRIV